MTALPRLRVVAVLLAGRSMFRGTLVLSAPILLSMWGDQAFAPYAVAVGTTLVLNPLVGSGSEKSAALLLSRKAAGSVDRGRLLGAQLAVGVAIALVSMIVAVALAVTLPGPADLFLLAAVANIGFGAVQAHVGYWRVLGRPYLDAVSFGVLAAATVAGLILASVGNAGPRVVLTVQAVAAMSVAATLVLGLRHRITKPRRTDFAVTARTTVLMGANTLLATAAISVVFAILARGGMEVAAGHIYLAILGYTILGNLLDYLLRVFQPWLASSLSDGAPTVVRSAERASRLGLTLLVPLSAAAVVLLSRSLSGPAEAILAVALVTPALLAVAALVWLLENFDTRTLVGTVLAGALGLVATAVTASALLAYSAVAAAALALLAGAAFTTVGLLPLLHQRATGRQKQLLVPTLGRQS